MSHTEAKWEVRVVDRPGRGYIIIDAETSEEITLVRTDSESLEQLVKIQHRANLLATAPKLLDACKRIDTFLSLDFPKMTPTQWAITVGELKGYLVPIIAAAEPSSHNGKEG